VTGHLLYIVQSATQIRKKNCEIAVKADAKGFFEIFFGYLFPEYLNIVKELLNGKEEV